jgi:hypothetical protein
MEQLEMFCACGTPITGSAESNTWVVNGVPCCSENCARRTEDEMAERELRNLRRVPFYDEEWVRNEPI